MQWRCANKRRARQVPRAVECHYGDIPGDRWPKMPLPRRAVWPRMCWVERTKNLVLAWTAAVVVAVLLALHLLMLFAYAPSQSNLAG